MKLFSRLLATCLFYCAASTFNTAIITMAHAEQPNNEQAQHTVEKMIYGKVTNTMDASGYTYAEIDTGNQRVWAAGPITALKTGDMVAFATVMPMTNFHSKALNRDFSLLYFVNAFHSDNNPAAAASTQIKQAAPALEIKVIEKVKDGNTIAEIYSHKNELNGKTIRLRGQVTKITHNVMNRNWLHIRDNSTTNDLTITSSDTAKTGDVVVIEGKLELDKDFGYGYLYPLIVEDAKITN